MITLRDGQTDGRTDRACYVGPTVRQDGSNKGYILDILNGYMVKDSLISIAQRHSQRFLTKKTYE